jgi:hypothetical protein
MLPVGFVNSIETTTIPFLFGGTCYSDVTSLGQKGSVPQNEALHPLKIRWSNEYSMHRT